MTVIAAQCLNEEILLGYSDGAELGGTPVAGTSIPWIFFGAWALGITGVSAAQRVLSYELKSKVDDGFQVDDVINCINGILVDNYFGSKDDGENVMSFGIYSILVNKDGRVWDVGGCLTFTQIPEGAVWAQGSGADYVIGADHALRKHSVNLSDNDRLIACLEAAIANDLYCIGNPVVRSWSRQR